MYEEFFRFATHPFRNSPDPSFFYRSANHRDALAMLTYGIREGKGFLLVTGDVGTGKTMLVQALKAELGDGALVVEVAYPWVSAEEIIAAVRARVGLPAVTSEGPEAIDALRQRLTELAAEKRDVVLVIDEAHQLPVKTLEGIRLISNIESSTRKLLQIILLGQDELGALLSQYSLRQVQQRIALSCHLRPLNRVETADYIRHRLHIANGNPELFSPAAADQVFNYSGGCPRLINQACDYCLLYAYGKFAPAIDEHLAREALANMKATRGISHLPENSPNSTAPAASEPVIRSASTSPSQAPATNQSAPLPIVIPGAGRLLQEGEPLGSVPGRGLLLIVGLLGLLALLTGGIALWFSLQKHESTPPPSGRSASSFGDAPRRMDTAVSTLESAQRLGVDVPGKSGSEARTVMTTTDLSLALLASQHFGAWNATVRDILTAANPQLQNLDALAPGSRVSLPVLNRKMMVVQDAAGRRFVYYASFDSEEAASAEMESLGRVWTKVKLVAAERTGGRVYRVYLGPFEAEPEVESVVSALWFKFLPTLSAVPAVQ